MNRYLMVLFVAACGSPRADAAPSSRVPSIELVSIAVDRLCVTKGAITDHAIDEPTLRAFAPGAGGDAAAITFAYRGETEQARALASGQLRRQIGLKLRAQDSCNVVYVMWRLDPTPALDVSVKHNPGQATHLQCGAAGYEKVKPARKTRVASYADGARHQLRAEIVDDKLFAWIDGSLRWQGRLPEAAREIAGPVGMRSDNVGYELLELAGPRVREPEHASCTHDGGE